MVAHRGWLAARDKALAGLAHRPALVVVLGEAGTGKTTLLRDLHRLLLESGIAAQFVPPVVPPPALDAADPNAVLLIDDANRLPDEVLAGLIGDDRRMILLADRPQFRARLQDGTRAPVWLELAPLNPEEVSGFLTASLPEEERDTSIFSPQAATRLAEKSGGVPRGLHSLAGMALLLATRERADAVEPRHVDQASVVGESGLQAALMAVNPPASDDQGVAVRVEAAAGGVPAVTVAEAAEQALVDREKIVWRLLAIGSACLVAVALGWQLMPSGPPASAVPRAPPMPPLPVVTPEPALPPPAPEPAAPAPQAAVAASAAEAPVSAASPPETQAAQPPVPAFALPTAALTEVMVRFPAGNAHAAHQAATLVTGLREDGFAVAEPSAIPTREQAGVRYVFAEDRAAAEQVAAAATRHVARLPIAVTRRKPAERDAAPIPGEVQIIVSGEGDT